MTMIAYRKVLLLIPVIILLSWGQPLTEFKHIAKAGEFPYVVRLLIDKLDGQIICTGTLIHAQWVLTAAHCTNGYTQIKVQAAMTEVKPVSFSMESSAETSIPYPGYVNKLALTGRNLNNDYSLIKLKSGFKVVPEGKIATIPLENATWTYRKERNCISVGFGAADNDEDGLHVFGINAIHGACPCITKDYQLRRFICTTIGIKYGSAICPGDSGGPLICNGKQVGIASHIYPDHACDLSSTRSSKDFGCGIPGTVSSFTYVCPVLTWIKENVGETIPQEPILC